jgi:hypothetical protein
LFFVPSYRHDIWLEKRKPTDSSLQTTLSDYTKNRVLPSGTLNEIMHTTVRWIVKDCRPLTVTSDEGFVSLMKIATGCDKYIPPSYATITESVHDMYGKAREDLKQ